jgi:hypothetical protein
MMMEKTVPDTRAEEQGTRMLVKLSGAYDEREKRRWKEEGAEGGEIGGCGEHPRNDQGGRAGRRRVGCVR